MELKIGDKLTIPFKPDHHLKKTGVSCIVKKIEKTNVYVSRYSERQKQYTNSWVAVDKTLAQKIKGGEYV